MRSHHSRRTSPRLSATATAGPLALVASGAQAAEQGKSDAQAQAAPASELSSGMRVYVDPATGKISVRFYLLDTVRGQQLMAYDMPPAAPDQMRYVAHQISDLVYQKLTGVPGAFNTKIAYVTASGLGNARRFEVIVADADDRRPGAGVDVVEHEALAVAAGAVDIARAAGIADPEDQPVDQVGRGIGVMRRLAPPGLDLAKIPATGPAPALLRAHESARVTPEWVRLAAAAEADPVVVAELQWVRDGVGVTVRLRVVQNTQAGAGDSPQGKGLRGVTLPLSVAQAPAAAAVPAAPGSKP